MAVFRFPTNDHDIVETFDNFFGSVFTADDGTTPKMDTNVNPSLAIIIIIIFIRTKVHISSTDKIN